MCALTLTGRFEHDHVRVGLEALLLGASGGDEHHVVLGALVEARQRDEVVRGERRAEQWRCHII